MCDARSGLWRQTWVDSQGAYFELTGGPQTDGRFIFENRRIAPNAPYLRIVFEDIEADSFTWRWRQSGDARETWADRWVIQYRRRR